MNKCKAKVDTVCAYRWCFFRKQRKEDDDFKASLGSSNPTQQ